jgi:hypothetical protein
MLIWGRARTAAGAAAASVSWVGFVKAILEVKSNERLPGKDSMLRTLFVLALKCVRPALPLLCSVMCLLSPSRGKLHEWLGLLVLHDALCTRYFQASSLVRSNARDDLARALEPLSLLPFKLDVDCEVVEKKQGSGSALDALRARMATVLK